jgi:hypothetical protein
MASMRTCIVADIISDNCSGMRTALVSTVSAATARPAEVIGTTSPKPTVKTHMTLKYKESNMFEIAGLTSFSQS